MKNKTLTTVYSEKTDKKRPWHEYPRPNLVRDSFFSLNGEWDFAFSENEPSLYLKKILVPFPPESLLSGMERAPKEKEKLYYRRSFTLPKGFIKNRVILHFGAVDQICEVVLNGMKIGKHEGGYIPFSFDITDYVFSSQNELRVICEDNLQNKYPYGKQRKKRGGMWYTPISGIWQTVWIESLPEDAIEEVFATPSLENVRIEVKTSAKRIKLTLRESGEVFESYDGIFIISPKNPKLWSPESPYLYRYTLESEHDRVESYFALREIGMQKTSGVTRLTLNGEPYLFHGLLDQGYFPDGLFLPATIDGYKADIKTAKALGFNMLRKHIKIEPAIFYYLCDEIGMLVFQDMVNNSSYSFLRDTALPTVGLKRLSDKHLHRNAESRMIFRQTAEQTIKHLYNYPSVVYYTIFNEGWGQFCADELYQDAKILDSTRIYDATSGWFWQKKSDVDSHHIYFKKLKLKIRPDIPSVISEFGGYSHRCKGHLYGSRNYGYKSFGTREELESSILSLYENEVLPLVKKGVSALVYTQLSDIEDETNGLLTYDRKVLKIDSEAMFDLSIKLKESIK
ncbi:MAG: glycoside hydrolase family 2 [Ruminococcaceae bacterium]|nr:glycoside hydrolase family 2 [Oscillospiraceae bacterium]